MLKLIQAWGSGVRRWLFLLVLNTAVVAQATAEDAVRLPVVTVQSQGVQSTHAVTRIANSQDRTRELSELLAPAAGVQVRSSGGLGAYAEASLRGSAARHVQVLFDGIPLELAGGQAINLALFPTAVVGRADIYRGGAPLALGASGAGAIDLRPPEQAVSGVQAGYGSFATWRGAVLGGWRGGLLSLGREMSDNNFPIRNPYKPFDPADPQRLAEEPRAHAGRDQHFGLLRHSWAWGDAGMDALVYGFSQDQALPDRVNSSDPGTTLGTDLSLANLRWRTADEAYVALQWQHLREHYADPGSRIGLGDQDLRMRSRRLALSSGDDGTHFGWFGQAAWHDYHSLDATAPQAARRVRRHQLTLAGVWHARPRQALALDASLHVNALRDDVADQDPRSRSQDELFFEPQLAWRYQRAGAWCAPLGHVAYRQRAPGFVERYGDRGYITGNPALKPESLTLLDAGLACQAERLSVRGAVFAQDLRHAISFVYDARGVGRAVNTDRAVIYGLEVETDWHVSALTDLSVNFTWLESEDRTEVRAAQGRQLPGRARWQGYARINQGLPAGGLPGRWRLFHEFLFEGEQYYDTSNLLKAPTTRLHSSGLHVDAGGVGLGLEVRNVLDQTHAQFNGFPRPGRSYHLSFKTTFD